MSLDPDMSPRRASGFDAGHFRRVRGLLTAGRVGATLAGSAWMVLTLAALAGGGGGGLVVGLAVVAVLVYLGGVITEIVGWFGLRGLDGHRGWATTVAILLIIECCWLLVGPLFAAMSFRDATGFGIATGVLVVSRATLLAVGYWARSGVAARVAAFAFTFAATGWLVLIVMLAGDRWRFLGVAIAATVVAALCEAIGHFATGAYFAENRPVPVDVSAFT